MSFGYKLFCSVPLAILSSLTVVLSGLTVVLSGLTVVLSGLTVILSEVEESHSQDGKSICTAHSDYRGLCRSGANRLFLFLSFRPTLPVISSERSESRNLRRKVQIIA